VRDSLTMHGPRLSACRMIRSSAPLARPRTQGWWIACSGREIALTGRAFTEHRRHVNELRPTHDY
jgi:hypothetical protein